MINRLKRVISKIGTLNIVLILITNWMLTLLFQTFLCDFQILKLTLKKRLFSLMKFKIVQELDYHLKILKTMEDIWLLEAVLI